MCGYQTLFFYSLPFFFLPRKSTFSSERTACLLWIHGYYFSLCVFNCYFHLECPSYRLISILKSYFSFAMCFFSVCAFADFFHSNTIINVFIDFFSLRYRLLLYRKPAQKRNDDETIFYTEFLCCGRYPERVDRIIEYLWRQFAFSVNSNPFGASSRASGRPMGGKKYNLSHRFRLTRLLLIHHSLFILILGFR